MPILLKFPSNYNRHPMYNGGTVQWQRKVVIRVQTTNQPDAQSNANPNRYRTTEQHAAVSLQVLNIQTAYREKFIPDNVMAPFLQLFLSLYLSRL